jgi:hypothetical protein
MLLRDVAAETGYVAACMRQAQWLVDWRVVADALTSHESRAAYEAVLRLHDSGRAVDLDSVATECGIPRRVLETFAWDADVPALVRHLSDLYRRRQLLVIGDAARVAAMNFGANPRDRARRLQAALQKVFS